MKDILNLILGGEFVSRITINRGVTRLEGQALTTEQQRAIQPLLDNGVPEVIDADAVDFEAGRRILAIAPEHSQRNATARSVELTEKIAEGGDIDN